jgi:putative tryptophan/tyrosine transport system substrate-binding protein
MMQRRPFIAAVAAGLTTTGLQAQPAGKELSIGLLMPSNQQQPLDLARLDVLRSALRDLGWIEGRNLRIEVRYAGVNPQRQRELAAELQALPVALIVAPGTITIRAARDGAPGLPVVMINAGDAVGAGFVNSLSRPGGNLTGTSAAGEEILAKQLELLRAAAPQLTRMAVLMNPSNPANGFFYAAMAARAKALGVPLERIEVSAADELDAAIERAKGAGLVVLGDPMFGRYRDRIVELTLRHQVPAIFGGRLYVAAGGLMSYLSADAWHWRSAAGFIDRILRGAKPADLPVEQPTQFDLILNLKTARALGLTFPQSLLLRADEVIE